MCNSCTFILITTHQYFLTSLKSYNHCFFTFRFISTALLIGNFRFEYKIEYKFSIPVWWALHCHITCQYILFLEFPSLLVNNTKEWGLWKRHWFKIQKSYLYSISYSKEDVSPACFARSVNYANLCSKWRSRSCPPAIFGPFSQIRISLQWAATTIPFQFLKTLVFVRYFSRDKEVFVREESS